MARRPTPGKPHHLRCARRHGLLCAQNPQRPHDHASDVHIGHSGHDNVRARGSCRSAGLWESRETNYDKSRRTPVTHRDGRDFRVRAVRASPIMPAVSDLVLPLSVPDVATALEEAQARRHAAGQRLFQFVIDVEDVDLRQETIQQQLFDSKARDATIVVVADVHSRVCCVDG
jgi:hypothetical protein